MENSGSILVERKSRFGNDAIYLGMCLYTENDSIGELEFEIDRAKLLGRTNMGIPKMIENSIPFTKNIGIVPDLEIGLRRTKRRN